MLGEHFGTDVLVGFMFVTLSFHRAWSIIFLLVTFFSLILSVVVATEKQTLHMLIFQLD